MVGLKNPIGDPPCSLTDQSLTIFRINPWVRHFGTMLIIEIIYITKNHLHESPDRQQFQQENDITEVQNAKY